MMRHLTALASVLWIGLAASAQEAPPVLPTEAAPTRAEAESEMMLLRESPALSVARAYGFDHWDNVEQVEFTFNVQRPGSDDVIRRKWTWRPREKKVTLHKDGGDVSYVQGKAKAEDAVAADKSFVNDSYWLLFPFQLLWSQPRIVPQGVQPLPIGEGEAHKFVVIYPEQGGYTPGDQYDLYVGGDSRIVQWVYRKGGDAAEQGRPATWEKHAEAGPIVVSLEHYGPDRKFHLWFSDVRVTVRAKDGERVTHEPKLLEAP